MTIPGRTLAELPDDRKQIRRVIANAIAEQGPAAREQYLAAVDVMGALSRAGFVIVRRDSLPELKEPW